MAQVKGLVVQIGGDTSGLDKAIKSASKGASALQKELNEINKALKLDPSSTTLLAQKQQVLSNKIKDTTNLLKSLKEEQAKYIKEGGDLNTAEYRKLERQIAQTTQELKQLNYENSKWKTASDNLKKFGDTMTKVGQKLSNFGKSLTTYVTLPIAGLTATSLKYAKEQESALQQVDKIYGNSAKVVKDFAENSAIAFNMSTNNAYKYSQVFGNLIQSITDDQNENAKLTIELLKASSVIASATGRTMEDVMDRIRSGLLGNTEAIEDLGVNVNVALLESTDAFKKFAGDKSWQQLDFQTQQQIRLFGILEQTTKKYGDEINQNTTTNVAELTSKLQNLGTEVGEKLLPYFNKIVDKLTELVDKFNELSPETQDMIIKIGLLVASLGPILLILGKVFTFIGSIANGLSQLSSVIGQVSASASAAGTSIGAIAGPVAAVIAVVAGLTAEFTHLYQTNEEFQAKVTEAWNNIVTFFQDSIMPFWNQLVELVKNVLSTIWEMIQEIWKQIEPYIQDAFEVVLDWWNESGKEIFADIMWILEKLLWAVNWIWSNVVTPLLKMYTENLKPAIDVFGTLVNSTLKFVLDTVTNVWNMVKGILSGVIDFVTGVFTGDWERAWNGVKNIFSSIWNGLTGIIKSAVNGIIDVVNSLIRGINHSLSQIPDAVPRNWWFKFEYTSNTKTS